LIKLTSDYRKYLDPLVISKLSNLELKAKFVVEGFISGLHQSPFHGFSVEFTEHRQYMPGDDLKYLDWKVLGRTDKYFIKQFEDETNLRLYLILDSSKSMSFCSARIPDSPARKLKGLFSKKTKSQEKKDTDGLTKLEYATYLAASLALLSHFQKDAGGLVVYDEFIKTYIPPRATNQNLKEILVRLSDIVPSGKTNTASSLNDLAERIRKRGLVIIFSDLFDNQDEIIKALKHFRYNKNEVLVFHILDPYEIYFAIDSPVVFRDMETHKELLTQPLSVVNYYSEAMQSFIEKYKKSFLADNIDYVLLSTETTFDVALFKYLNKRKKLH